jgi:WD40 repeat protein
MAKLWKVETGKEVRTLGGHSASVFSVAFSPDGRLVATGSADETAKLWYVPQGL